MFFYLNSIGVSPVQANRILAFDAQGLELEPSLAEEWLNSQTFPADTCFQNRARGADAT
jgi:hypothetical protein